MSGRERSSDTLSLTKPLNPLDRNRSLYCFSSLGDTWTALPWRNKRTITNLLYYSD